MESPQDVNWTKYVIDIHEHYRPFSFIVPEFNILSAI